MPIDTIPLVGSLNQRGTFKAVQLNSVLDQIFKGVLFDVVRNPNTGESKWYCRKRPGISSNSAVLLEASTYGVAICDNRGVPSLSSPCTAVSTKVSNTAPIRFYVGTGYVGQTGTMASGAYRCDITSGIVAGEQTYLMTVPGQGGYFIGTTGMSGGLTFTGDTHTNTTIDNVSSVTGLVIGQLISGTNIAANTRIQNIVGTTLTVTVATTGTTAGVTITRERMSKIIDADFPDPLGPMVELDGFIFVGQNASQKVWNSDLNTIQAWTATSFISASQGKGNLLGVSRRKNLILAHCSTHIQQFYNAGNPTGSVLATSTNVTFKITGYYGPGSNSFDLQRPFDFLDDIVVVAYQQVYIITDAGMKKISNDIVDTLGYQSQVQIFSMNGKYFVYMNAIGNNIPDLLYDVNNEIWTKAGFPYYVISTKNSGEVVYATDSLGYYYSFPDITPSSSSYTDAGTAGAAVPLSITTSRIDHGTDKRKFVSKIWLVSDAEPDSYETPSFAGVATLTCSDDDYRNFKTVGTFDMTNLNKCISGAGSHKGGRVYRIVHTANKDFRATALRIEYKVGSQ